MIEPDYSSDVITNNPNLTKYLINEPRKRPKIKIKSVDNNLVITRKSGWFKKQIFTFVKYTDKGIDVLATNFLLFFGKFIDQERKINDTQSLKDLIYLFEQDSIFILPKVLGYIQDRITANQHMYLRFMTMVNSLEMLINPDTISYVNLCYLKAVVKFNDRYYIPRDNNDIAYISSVTDIESMHQYLDMITLFPWSYLLFIYKFNKYSDFRNMAKVE